MSEPLLADLAEEVREISESAEMDRRKKLWTTLLRGERPEKPPVLCGVFMNRWFDGVWDRLIGEETLRFKSGPERDIEVQLRKKLYKFYCLQDDEVVKPSVWTYAKEVTPRDQMWGPQISRRRTGDEGGAYKEIPPLTDPADLDKVICPHYEEDLDADNAEIDVVRELIDDRLQVKRYTAGISFAPYEVGVLLRGAESLLFDLYDRPQFVHELMSRITDGVVQYTREREAAGAFDVHEGFMLHEPWDEMPEGREHELSAGWVYTSAQSAAPLGPGQFAEFVQPYVARIAELFGKVYYHGCEDLGGKIATLKDLPNLKHFHVSPWTDVKKIVPELRGRKVAMEVHGHPTNVLFVFTPEEIREETRRRMSECEDLPFDYVLCDIQTVEGRGEKLAIWCDIAQEEAARL